MKNKLLTIFFSWLFAVVFVFLGFWQLGRAHDVQRLKAVKPDAPAISLNKVAKPGTNLEPDAVNRIVNLSGTYVKSYIAPNQKVSSENKTSLEVRLMKLKSGGGVLVVRGIEDMNYQNLPSQIRVLGRLYPRQTADLAKYKSGVLTRIDPSLITSDTNLDLIDGYVIAISEKNELGQAINSERVLATPLLPRVAGYYWQRLTYVVIWWLFALLVLLAPFYDRLRGRKVRVR